MRLSDLLPTLPGLVLLAILPGLAVATLIAPRWAWWERAVVTPALSCGLVGVVGLTEHLLHASFRLATVLPADGVLVLAAAWRWQRNRGDDAASPTTPPTAIRRIQVLVAVAAGILSVSVVLIAYRSSVAPTETDIAVHATTATAIGRTDSIFPTIPAPVEHTEWVRPHVAVEATAALLADLDSQSTSPALVALMLLGVAVLPLSLLLLLRELGTDDIVALLAPGLAGGIAFPAVALQFGEYPYIIDAALVTSLIVASLRALRGDHTRDNVVLVGAMVAAMWAIHGLEIITAVLIGVPVCAGLLYSLRSWQLARRAIALIASAGLGALVVTVLTRVPSVASSFAPANAGTGGESSSFANTIGHLNLIDAFNAVLTLEMPPRITMILAGAGVVAGILHRRSRWAFVAFLLVSLVLADILSFGILKRLWVAVYPWSAVDRLPELWFWSVPVLAAVGITAFATLGIRLTKQRRVGVGVATVLAMGVVVFGVNQDSIIYNTSISGRSTLATSDLMVFHDLDQSYPSGTIVINDGIDDAGQWLGVWTRLVPFFDNGYVKADPHDGTMQAITDACTNPGAAVAAIKSTGAPLLLVGGIRRGNADQPWDPACIAKLPDLRVVAQAISDGTTTTAYAVN